MTTSVEIFLAKQPRRQTTRALRGLYEGILEPPEAAALYCSDVSSSPNLEKANRQLYGLWWSIKEASYHPELHEKLADMLDAIRFLPDIVRGDETIVKWSEYPQLDAYDLILYRDKHASYNDNKNYINEIAFIAKLSSRRIPHADFLDWAVNMPEFETDTIEKSVKGDKEALYELQSEVPHSAQWIFYAGKNIFEEKYADESATEEPWKWNGKQPVVKNDFTRERWDTWKKRAKQVAELAKVNKETREIAQKMADVMEKIEKDPEAVGENV